MMQIKDERLLVFKYTDGSEIIYWATARRVGMSYQAGIYCVTDGVRGETDWREIWGSNPQKAMRNLGKRVRVQRDGDNLIVVVEEL